MAKSTTKSHKKSFSLDLESLLLSDCSQDGQNDDKTTTTESFNPTKKCKINKKLPSNSVRDITNLAKGGNSRKRSTEENDPSNDMPNFFENVGTDFSKSMNVKKARLEEFTEAVISVYQGKINQMIKKQEDELEEFKNQTINHIAKELNKCENEFKKLRFQENKLIKILEQQVKMMQKMSTTQAQWIANFAILHENFVQAYEELKTKHKNEVLELKKNISVDVTSLQDKFLIETKKEEMHTIKNYLRSVYF